MLSGDQAASESQDPLQSEAPAGSHESPLTLHVSMFFPGLVEGNRLGRSRDQRLGTAQGSGNARDLERHV